MPDSLAKKVGLASLIMMTSVFLSRIIGLLREMVIAYIGGAQAEVDAYQVAFVIPEILNHIVASGFLSVTFIPIFSSYLARNEEDQGWKVFSNIFFCFGSLLIIFVGAAMILAPELIAILAPGMNDPWLQAKAVRMTRIILPAQLLFFAGGLLMAVQFSKEKFLIPALAPLLYNAGIIICGLVLGPRIGMEGFAWGVLIGAFCGNLLVQYWGAQKIGMTISPMFDFKHPDFKQYVLLTLPLMVGLTMTFSTEFFFRFFGSFLPRGGIAVLNFGLRIMLILVGLFGQAVGTASYPFLARLAVEKKIDEMNRLINNSLRFLALVIPVSVLFMVIRSEVVLMLFQRGKFGAAATALTAEVLAYFLIGAFAYSAYTVVIRGYFATRDTLFPALYGSGMVLLSVPLYYFGMRLMAAAGVALAVSLSGILQVWLLYLLWNKRSRNKGSRRVYFFYLKMIIFSVPTGLILAWFKSAILSGIDTATFFGSLAVSVITGCVFLIILLTAGFSLQMNEVTELTRRLIGKMKPGM